MILSTDVNRDKGLSSSHWLSAFKQELSDVSMKATGWWQAYLCSDVLTNKGTVHPKIYLFTHCYVINFCLQNDSQWEPKQELTFIDIFHNINFKKRKSYRFGMA